MNCSPNPYITVSSRNRSTKFTGEEVDFLLDLMKDVEIDPSGGSVAGGVKTALVHMAHQPDVKPSSC